MCSFWMGRSSTHSGMCGPMLQLCGRAVDERGGGQVALLSFSFAPGASSLPRADSCCCRR